MAVKEPGTRREMPASLVQAIDGGELTEAQLRELITFEAAELGLSFDEAVQRARARTLPKNPIGSDLQLLAMMLPS